MDRVSALIRKYFSAAGGELRTGGVSVSALAAKYGTPLFVYDHEVLEKKWACLRNAVPPDFSICYSVKANPTRMILQFFLAKQAGLEVASAGEFCLALDAGCSPEKIIFAGPGKTESELELVLRRGIGEIHIESDLEAKRVASISRRLGLTANVAVRVNPSGEAEGGAMRMGGRPAPFGIDEENLDDVLDRICADSQMNFRGIHLFTGTQILDYAILLSQYRKGVEIARRVATRLGRSLKTVDFGGGLGIPYFSHETELDTEKLHTGLKELMEGVRADARFSGTRFVLEPGRYLVGEAGIYVTRVSDIKASRGKKFLILDGGMHHHLAASGNLGQTIKRNYPLALLNRLDEPPEETVDVVGPLCTPLDVLGRGIDLPRAQVGDLVGIFQSGAYARSASPLSFLSHPTPPEVWVGNGCDQILRRAGDYADYLDDQYSSTAAH